MTLHDQVVFYENFAGKWQPPRLAWITGISDIEERPSVHLTVFNDPGDGKQPVEGFKYVKELDHPPTKADDAPQTGCGRHGVWVRKP